MAKTIHPNGAITLNNGEHGATEAVREYSVQATSGILGSLIHGLRLEICFRADSETVLNMSAADALQLAEEIRTAVHNREDVRR